LPPIIGRAGHSARAQRIASTQQYNQALGQCLDHRNFQSQPGVLDGRGKWPTSTQKATDMACELVDAGKQCGRGTLGVQFFDRAAGSGQGIERNVHAIELAVGAGTILQMIDNLQRRAKRIVGRPKSATLAVDVEDETSNRHGGIGAISDQVVPVVIAKLGHVHAEGGQQVLGMPR
jgi:hypothetical protein